MKYNEELWNQYTDDNITQKNPSGLIYQQAVSLGARSVLEVGCNVGNNLKDFPSDFRVCGIDLNKYALEKARKRFPNFEFKLASADKIPYHDNSFDLVFTRTVLIHIPEHIMKKTMDEMYRVSKKWIMNMEFYNDTETMINWQRGKDLLWYRNMKRRWSGYNVKILKDADITKDVDIDNTRMTVVEKSKS